jgi:hypothetical protein
MNTQEIEALIGKYLEGETTLDEEKRLAGFFRTEEVPPHLAGYAAQFRYFSEAAEEELNDQKFEEKLLAEMENRKVIPMRPVRKKLWLATGIAAAILLLAGFFTVYRYETGKFDRQVKDTYSDPQMAYNAVRNALLLVSVNLNSGIDQVQKIGCFDQGLRQIRKFSEFDKYQPLIINPDGQNTRP